MKELISNLIGLYTFVVLIRVILSWFPSRGGPIDTIRDLTGRVTEPLLGPIRRALPSMGGLDLSPVVLLLALQLLRNLILR
ncbi:MAG: YggT family protein [Acidimicrobiia bacterium]